MVFQDGSWYTDRNGNVRILDAIDNLIAQKRIPVMICVFIDPGDISDSAGTPTYIFVKAFADKWQRTLKDSMRSTLYDTVSDRYPRFLRDEILTEVESKYSVESSAVTAYEEQGWFYGSRKLRLGHGCGGFPRHQRDLCHEAGSQQPDSGSSASDGQ